MKQDGGDICEDMVQRVRPPVDKLGEALKAGLQDAGLQQAIDRSSVFERPQCKLKLKRDMKTAANAPVFARVLQIMQQCSTAPTQRACMRALHICDLFYQHRVSGTLDIKPNRVGMEAYRADAVFLHTLLSMWMRNRKRNGQRNHGKDSQDTQDTETQEPHSEEEVEECQESASEGEEEEEVEEETKAAATASNVFADGGCTKGPAGHELDDEHLSAKKEPSKDELQEGPVGKEQPAGEEVDGEDLDGEELDSEEDPAKLDGQELDGDEDNEVLDGEVLEMEEKEEEADSQVTLQLWGGDCNEDCICISDSDVPPSQPADPALPQKPAQPATPAQPAHAQPPEPKVALSAQPAPQPKTAHANPAQPAQLAPARKPEQPTQAAELPEPAPARLLQTPPAQPARLLSRIELECILQGPAQKGAPWLACTAQSPGQPTPAKTVQLAQPAKVQLARQAHPTLPPEPALDNKGSHHLPNSAGKLELSELQLAALAKASMVKALRPAAQIEPKECDEEESDDEQGASQEETRKGTSQEETKGRRPGAAQTDSLPEVGVRPHAGQTMAP